MSFEQIHSELEDLLALSVAMLSHARHERWDDVIALEGERREVLDCLFCKPVGEGNQERLAEVICTILDNDQEVGRLVAGRRDALHHDIEKLTRGKGAVRAYSTA